MGQSVCRAITLYSYHIPIMRSRLRAQYSTIGFFDGMSTRNIEINYGKEDLKSLWWYATEQTRECDGSYSFQNIFALADSDWNRPCTDELFWEQETDQKYPLTLIVCLQLKDYIYEPGGIRKQCEEFYSIAQKHIGEGISYVYTSIDKNEFIVCLKCKNYHNAVRTVKALHKIENNTVVYGYTVFSVNHEVLQQLTPENYPYLYQEVIESICFKGIANSIKNEKRSLTLDEKYYDLCRRLTDKLYQKDERIEHAILEGKSVATGQHKDRTYDILGDDDFRYAARDVKLGRLLYEYRQDGLLSYSNEEFAFYLFSSSLVLNTRTELKRKVKLFDGKAHGLGAEQIDCRKQKYCDQVARTLVDVGEIITEKYDSDEKVWAIYYALYQLLQSFRVLEASPAKRYDFFSMFPPFKMLVELVEEKLKEGDRIAAKKKIFEFIHKISMTFHSAQRTDIRFFQIQDFNVIVHYSPAKLRAFYAMWILNLADLYARFREEEQKEYSFIFAPGMFGNTRVQELVLGSKADKRLMLVTLPDRSVYQIKRLLIVLSHEAGHFGCRRHREERHNHALKACARAAVLEIHAFMLYEIRNWGKSMDADLFVGMVRNRKDLLREIEEALAEESEEILQQFGSKDATNKKRDNECRKGNSVKHMTEAFDKMFQKYGEKIVAEYCCEIKNAYFEARGQGKSVREYETCVGSFLDSTRTELLELIKMFHNIQLKKILNIFYHIEKEAFADLITILTLEHSMKDYIFSFIGDEITLENLGNASEGSAVIVRMALVIEIVGEVVEKDWKKVVRSEFIDEWKKGQLEELCRSFPEESVEEIIAGKIHCYMDSVTDSLNQISGYNRMYNSVKRGYTNNVYAPLTDQEVWKALHDCLYLGVKAYIDTLFEPGKTDIYNKKYTVAEVYKELQEATAADVVQIIEGFLYNFECGFNLD